MKVAAWLLWLAQSQVGGEAGEAACDEGADVCLLQSGQFMQKSLADEAGPVLLHVKASTTHEDPGPECPGAPVELVAEQGKCSAAGVDVIVKDGSSITEFFGDNVQMKDFHFYVNGAKDAWVNLKEFHFQVGSHAVVVEGRDLAELTKRCHRSVTVRDVQKPTWSTDVASVLTSVPMTLDETCTRTASSTLNEYEQLGWSPSAADNCPGSPEIQRQVKKKGVVVYDDSQPDSGDLLSGPGSYELVYTATDAAGVSVQHTAVVHLQDKASPPPGSVAGCPADVRVEVEATATQGVAQWTLPHLGADNCLTYGKLPGPVEANGREPGAKYALGDHIISYSLRDSSGNVAPEECSFTVSVESKAHPVVLTCPPSETFNTVTHAEFGVPHWGKATATQGGVRMVEGKIEYLHGVRPGLPFPYGTTHVTVKAHGEGDETDECTFTVTIHDPEHPQVDGRMFRCGGEGEAQPYDVCDGTDLVVAKHDGYAITGGYDLKGTEEKSNLACCADQQGTEYECAGTGEGYLFKYCKPTESSVPAPDLTSGGAPDPTGGGAETPCYTGLAGDCNGNVIRSMIGITLEGCKEACDVDANCIGVAYSPKSYKKKPGKCILKSSKNCKTPPGACTKTTYCYYTKGGPDCTGTGGGEGGGEGLGSADGEIGNPSCKNPGGGVCLSAEVLLQVEHEQALAPMRTFVAADCGACKTECKGEAACQWYAFCPKENPQCTSRPDQCRLWAECNPPRFFSL